MISAESPGNSIKMKNRHQAPFTFIADDELEIINVFGFRNGSIARPGFVLLKQGREVWRRNEKKFRRTDTAEIIHAVTGAMAESSQQSDGNE